MIRLYLDFDGTITTHDTGDGLFQEFGDWQYWCSKLMSGELDVRGYYNGVCRSLKPEFNAESLKTWADDQPVDAGLSPLLKTCANHNVQVYVVSDGFRNYIEPILDRLPSVERSVIRGIYANAIDLSTMRPSFPGATESCSCFCASCKRNTIITTGADEDLIIYVGDGQSDVCAAQHADVVFAKDYLAQWMHDNKWPHHPWRSLYDVSILLDKHCRKPMWKKRRAAELARKNAVEGE